MRNEFFTKGFAAGAAITAQSIVKLGAADNTVILCTAAPAQPIGISDALGAAAAGDIVDVIMYGIASLKIAGTITRGGAVMSNGSGLGIAHVVGATTPIVGIALDSGVTGDVISVQLAPTVTSA